MRIAFFETEGWEESMIKQAFPNDEIYTSKEKITPSAIPEKRDCEVLSVFVNSQIDKTVLDAFPDLKCIATRSTGFDHIDLAACKKRNITVVYVPGYGDNTVAEYAFGLILNLTRKIYKSIDQIKETESFVLDGMRGIDLKGKTMGIVGTGRIGKESVRIAKGFGMNVIAYDLRPNEAYAKEAGITYVTMDELLARADVITLHCPFTPETKHLINKKNIQNIKRGAYLVNTARGGIVETEALVEALEKGILAGYGTDVLEEEGDTKNELHIMTTGNPKSEELKTMIRNHILMKMPNVLITPHNAFNSKEALERIMHTTVENIKGFCAGNIINETK